MSNFSRDDQLIRRELNNPVPGGESHTYPAAVELFSQGASAGDVYFVHAGIVKLSRSEANGQEILLDLRFPGSLIGAAAVISRKSHPAAALTVTRCTLTRWSSQQFLSLIATDISLALRVREVLSDEVLDHIARISQLTCVSARQRLEHFFWQLCERFSAADRAQQSESAATKFQLPLKHHELANLLSITPTYLCRLLNALEIEDLVSRRQGWIVVHKPGRLWHSGES